MIGRVLNSISISMLVASAALLLIATSGLVARMVNSRRQPVIVAAALAPWLMAAVLPAAVLAIAARQWIAVAVSAVLLGAAVATQWPLYRARLSRNRAAAGERPLRVMQANILIGGADPGALAASVDLLDIDVLTICELTPQGLDRLMASRLPELLPYHYCSTGEYGDGTGIWSRYPLSDTRRHDGFVTELLSARVELPDDPSPLVFAVHPVPPWPRKPGDWLREMELLHQLLAKIPDDAGPVLVAGDFNATMDHRPYRALLDGDYRDAAVAVGAGILPTYAADRWYPPVIAIDHILLRDAIAHEVHTVELPGSDHRGIWASITI
ncbi:MAG: endonuclease/exonuclease/phosphatase family protein [Nocardia sp.]|uniref:endonuclease/exonuclease/phosphatase family protein n=1 Tax=Nocardia sp. TaxID=1821 RepID=UPI0026208DEA|nr:endonuclease/exonuclease/phosphatase family protein [Nocardia sp.]MCU1644999.1 endonuclease/exonuclease/phosphatase family protein [Nocardia sp.]